MNSVNAIMHSMNAQMIVHTTCVYTSTDSLAHNIHTSYRERWLLVHSWYRGKIYKGRETDHGSQSKWASTKSPEKSGDT